MTTEEKLSAALKAAELHFTADVLQRRAKELREMAESLDRQAAQIRDLAGPLPK